MRRSTSASSTTLTSAAGCSGNTVRVLPAVHHELARDTSAGLGPAHRGHHLRHRPYARVTDGDVLTGYSARKEGLAADDAAEDELEAFEKERRFALLILAAATMIGLVLPVAAVVFYLAISVLIVVDPLWRAQRRRRAVKSTATRA